jgi:hypothetical protein
MGIFGMSKSILCALAALLLPAMASAVYLNPDGSGQALIFPYYTVQSASGNGFNTYLSIVNRSNDAKALRLRIREARNSRAVASINVFVAANDMWTGAIVPGPGVDDPPRLISRDASCTSPVLPDEGLALDRSAFTGALEDQNGADTDRLREGFVEVLEMGVLAPPNAADAAPPRKCASLSGPVAVTAPSGGLSGTITLINVANGTDFAVNATALAELASKPYFRVASDPYPDFNATEIDPWSVTVQGGFAYRAVWTRPVDAVSAALMVRRAFGEFVLDTATRSRSELVVTYPTRHFYVTQAGAVPPFIEAARWAFSCTSIGDELAFTYRSRSGIAPSLDLPASPPFATGIRTCSAVVPFSFRLPETNPGNGPSQVFGSRLRETPRDPALFAGFVNGTFEIMNVAPFVTNSSIHSLTSQTSSQRVDLSTGAVTVGASRFLGYPMIGFWVRTFENGTLSCEAGKCQGNYGAAFPLTRSEDTAVVP